MKAKLIVGLGLLLGVVGVSQADTIFNGGTLGTAGDWSNGLPGSGNPGTVDVDGYLGSLSQDSGIFSGATVTVGSGATLTSVGSGADFPAAGGNTWIINDATVNLGDDFFSRESTFILNAGSSVNAVDDFKAQSSDGNITINGGTHTAGDQFGSTPFTSSLDFLGGSVVAGRYIFDVGVVTIGGTAVATATGTTLATDVDGNVNILSDWSGSLTANSFTGTEWSTAAIGNWKLDGTTVDATAFATSFEITNGGKTLSVIPEPATIGLLGMAAAGMILIRRIMM